jgi:hypothetical protein
LYPSRTDIDVSMPCTFVRLRLQRPAAPGKLTQQPISVVTSSNIAVPWTNVSMELQPDLFATLPVEVCLSLPIMLYPTHNTSLTYAASSSPIPHPIPAFIRNSILRGVGGPPSHMPPPARHLQIGPSDRTCRLSRNALRRAAQHIPPAPATRLDHLCPAISPLHTTRARRAPRTTNTYCQHR